jgi:hypothetical protein
MFVGHLAVGLVGKRVEPKISLGTLVFATMLADFLWAIFMLAGIDHAEFKAGVLGAGNYFDASNIAMSHSLLMDAIWGALFAAAYFLRRRYARAAWILFAAVLSHWLLDFVAHRPDMPLALGVHRYLGLGLWTSVPATVAVEGGFWLLAIMVYLRATHARSRAGVYAFWSVIAVLTLLWYNNIAGPPPPNPHTASIGSLILFSLAVAWAYWMNHLRLSKSDHRQLC